MQRHVNIAHPDLKLADCFRLANICGFKLARVVGPNGLPDARYKYCSLAFKTEKELAAHKQACNHFKPKPAKKKSTVGQERLEEEEEVVVESEEVLGLGPATLGANVGIVRVLESGGHKY